VFDDFNRKVANQTENIKMHGHNVCFLKIKIKNTIIKRKKLDIVDLI
jgi:hypothetical protein